MLSFSYIKPCALAMHDQNFKSLPRARMYISAILVSMIFLVASGIPAAASAYMFHA